MPIEGNLELGTVKILFYKTRSGWKSAVFSQGGRVVKSEPHRMALSGGGDQWPKRWSWPER